MRERGTHEPLSAAERSLRGRLGAYVLHATHDSRAITAEARATFMARFEVEVDPDGVLTPEERRRRADHARQAYFTRLALKSAQTRRRKRAKNGTRREAAGSGKP